MKSKTKIILVVWFTWFLIAMIALFFVIKSGIGSPWAGLILILINSILHATVAFNSNTIYTYLFNFFEKNKKKNLQK